MFEELLITRVFRKEEKILHGKKIFLRLVQHGLMNYHNEVTADDNIKA
jgi:hypothetical protein